MDFLFTEIFHFRYRIEEILTVDKLHQYEYMLFQLIMAVIFYYEIMFFDKLHDLDLLFDKVLHITRVDFKFVEGF